MLITLSAAAQESEVYWFTLDSLSIKQTDKEWGKWKPVNLMSCFELNRNRFVIYSPQLQIFNFITIIKDYDSRMKYPRFGITAYDKDKTNCTIQFWYNPPEERAYVWIRYLNGEYKYMIK